MVRRVARRVVAGTFALALLCPIGASAGVNCKFVLKNLSLPGRTVESVAETMSISEEEIRNCQEQAAEQAAAANQAAEKQVAEQVTDKVAVPTAE